ncbi:hypothetical protein BDM02DRAFT_2168189 [Thelephora ganbajun]|uniref:Uncharacterized protein n=1 Tax=Thelephora ganbajun TaxID=370292 RepID=A0ACB6ZUQ7_THEGA|nr:hypothetical protein BDM02DRAFT_2168189 [Thelephora ganbajun]
MVCDDGSGQIMSGPPGVTLGSQTGFQMFSVFSSGVATTRLELVKFATWRTRHVMNHVVQRTLNWHHNRFGISPLCLACSPPSPPLHLPLFLPPLSPLYPCQPPSTLRWPTFSTHTPPQVNALRLMTAATVLVFRSGDVHNPNFTNTQPAYGTRIHKTSSSNHNPPPPQLAETHTHTPLRKLKLVSSNAKVNPPSSSQEIATAPVFPPPGVMLHSEDATNKVLKAIGRSFLSVDNRAMTIKDLAEMCMGFGLSCQNASAAGQAITSFIRNHMQRCDFEQDQPLLLKHTLSGTPSDDDLVPALYSRSGGAHCALNDTERRVTNFRRGTVIWYLSRAAGAPCPFARAGVRLCDYKYTGDAKFEEQQCGHKRKRLLRARAGDKGDSDSDDLPSDSERRPLKVKLLLRLKPLVSPPSTDVPPDPTPQLALSEGVNDGSMSHASSDDEGECTARSDEPIFPPYPRPSISIPVYTPSLEDIYPELFTPVTPMPVHRRSSSITHSVASPPPDSDDDDYDPMIQLCRHPSSSNLRRCDDDDFDSDFDTDLDFDFEGETRDESSGPRSPSTPANDDGVVIKVETSDSGLWGDWDGRNSGSNAGESSAATPSSMYLKKEELDLWNWNGFNDFRIHDLSQPPTGPEASLIKQEDVDFVAMRLDDDDNDDVTLLGPLSAVEPSNSADLPSLLEERKQSANIWKDVELLGPDSLRLQDFDEGDWPNIRLSPHHPRAHTISNVHAPSPLQSKSEPILPRLGFPELDRKPDRSSTPSIRRPSTFFSSVPPVEHPELPICLIHLDGVIVYELVLGPHQLLRRFDTDFVNLTRIAECLGASPSSFGPDLPRRELVEGCPSILGIWAPLNCAREFMHTQSLVPDVLEAFLSNTLYEDFPCSIRNLYRSYDHLRSLQQLGPPFRSMVEHQPSLSIDDTTGQTEIDTLVLPFSEGTTLDTPLSVREEEIFQTLCACPDWDVPSPSPVAEPKPEKRKIDEKRPSATQRPSRTTKVPALRRSKRVAEALASRPRTRLGKNRA